MTAMHTPFARSTVGLSTPTPSTNPESAAMTHHHYPGNPNNGAPDACGPGAPPPEPDEGPVPARIPVDPEHDRAIDPDASRVWPRRRADREVGIALWH